MILQIDGRGASLFIGMLLNIRQTRFVQVKWITTRQRRPCDDESTYCFVDEDEFSDMELVQSIDYAAQHYGLSRTEIEKILVAGGIPVVNTINLEPKEFLRSFPSEGVISVFVSSSGNARPGFDFCTSTSDREMEVTLWRLLRRMKMPVIDLSYESDPEWTPFGRRLKE